MTTPQDTPHGDEPGDEPGRRRLRRYGISVALTVAAVACVLWLLAADHGTRRESDANAHAADRLCEQVTRLGQTCVTATDAAGVASAQAIIPIATGPAGVGSGRATPTPGGTDQPGVPQAYQPDAGALIVAVSVQGGRLMIAYDDGSRVDAGAVDPAVFAIVLRPPAGPTPTPAVTVTPTTAPTGSPTGTPTAEEPTP